MQVTADDLGGRHGSGLQCAAYCTGRMDGGVAFCFGRLFFLADNFRKKLKDSQIQMLFRNNDERLRRVFMWAARRDCGPGGSAHSIDIKEFGMLLRSGKVIDQMFTNVRVCHVFIQANYEEDGGDWQDWDWEMEFSEFLEALARIAVLKVSKADQLVDKIEIFLDVFYHNVKKYVEAA